MIDSILWSAAGATSISIISTIIAIKKKSGRKKTINIKLPDASEIRIEKDIDDSNAKINAKDFFGAKIRGHEHNFEIEIKSEILFEGIVKGSKDDLDSKFFFEYLEKGKENNDLISKINDYKNVLAIYTLQKKLKKIEESNPIASEIAKRMLHKQKKNSHEEIDSVFLSYNIETLKDILSKENITPKIENQ